MVPAAMTEPSARVTSSARMRPHSLVSRCARWARVSGATCSIHMPRFVPQSNTLTMSSWATSTRRRVRYPESAVRSAVSPRPLRVPWVEMKYSSTDRPSRNEALIGRGIISPRGLDTRPFMAAIWRICWELPRAPESTIIRIGLSNLAFITRSVASPTSLFALVQISISCWRRSSSTMTPRR